MSISSRARKTRWYNDGYEAGLQDAPEKLPVEDIFARNNPRTCYMMGYSDGKLERLRRIKQQERDRPVDEAVERLQREIECIGASDFNASELTSSIKDLIEAMFDRRAA